MFKMIEAVAPALSLVIVLSAGVGATAEVWGGDRFEAFNLLGLAQKTLMMTVVCVAGAAVYALGKAFDRAFNNRGE